MAGKDYDKLVVEIVSRHAEVAELQFIRDDLDGFKVTPISGGSVNHVFLVTSLYDGRNEEKLLFKHADWTPKGFPDGGLTTHRIHSEFYTSQMLYNYSDGSSPKMICLDTTTNTAIMEYIENAKTLTQMLCCGDVNLNIAQQVGEVFGALHKNTWLSTCDKEKQSRLFKQYSDQSLRANKREFDFMTCLEIDHMYNRIEEDNLAAFKELLKDGSLREALDDLYDYVQNTSQCVIHNDAHASSVLVSGPKIKVIDTEFADLNVAAKDIGLVLAFYLMLFYKAKSERKQCLADKLFQAIKEIVEKYMMCMSTVLTSHKAKQTMIKDITKFIGHSLLRWSIFSDLHIHLDLPPSVKPICWKSAKAMLEIQDIQNSDELFVLISGSVQRQ